MNESFCFFFQKEVRFCKKERENFLSGSC